MLRNGQCIVDSTGGLIIISPEPSSDALHPSDRFNAPDIIIRNEVMSSCQCFLYDHLRTVFEKNACLPLDGLREKDNRCEHEYERGIHNDKGNILPFPPEKGREREVENVSMLIDPGHIDGDEEAVLSMTRKGNAPTTSGGPERANAGLPLKDVSCTVLP